MDVIIKFTHDGESLERVIYNASSVKYIRHNDVAIVQRDGTQIFVTLNGYTEIILR